MLTFVLILKIDSVFNRCSCRVYLVYIDHIDCLVLVSGRVLEWPTGIVNTIEKLGQSVQNLALKCRGKSSKKAKQDNKNNIFTIIKTIKTFLSKNSLENKLVLKISQFWHSLSNQEILLFYSILVFFIINKVWNCKKKK